MIGFGLAPALFALPLALLPLVSHWLRTAPLPRLELRPSARGPSWPDITLRALGCLAIAALILGLARPFLRGGTVPYQGQGSNLVLLIDRSSSMDDTFAGRAASGGEESKAAAARRILLDFIAARPDDRIGIAAFSTAPMVLLPMSTSRSAIAAAVNALAEPGLSQTDAGRGLALAMDLMSEASEKGARAIVMVSDGAAVIAPEVQQRLREQALEREISLYWLYLRSEGSKSIFEAPLPGEADTPQVRPERHLHLFLSRLGVPYRAFEAETAEAVAEAVAEIDKLESKPILSGRRLPRRDLAWACYLIAGFALSALTLARLAERPWAVVRPAALMVKR